MDSADIREVSSTKYGVLRSIIWKTSWVWARVTGAPPSTAMSARSRNVGKKDRGIYREGDVTTRFLEFSIVRSLERWECYPLSPVLYACEGQAIRALVCHVAHTLHVLTRA